jgi:prevent-host-death family protein
MIIVNISELRANLLKYVEKASQGQQITVTTNGRAVATIGAPLDQKEAARAQLAALAETAKIGDIVSPVGEPWDVMS